MKTISVAHSPDADDIFMYYAIKFGWVTPSNAKFENIADDIESLNQATLKGEYDICAISFASKPDLLLSLLLLQFELPYSKSLLSFFFFFLKF